MLPSVTAVEEVSEAILKCPTVEDVHMYPLQEKMLTVWPSDDRTIEFEVIINRKKYSVVISTDKVDLNDVLHVYVCM